MMMKSCVVALPSMKIDGVVTCKLFTQQMGMAWRASPSNDEGTGSSDFQLIITKSKNNSESFGNFLDDYGRDFDGLYIDV